ncbi:hypothetical protein KCN56_01820 [Photobacterium galatheae]|uniref:toxin-antitoxin system YwqK family antitoxin n=1 Tax=Photobacterium galatheae TaxID=1654360 RepID=UPI00202CFA40|nr:hypothetical protein [Photobacterium galatheae]MCM0147304.1 hypothetical protein [Photobacterium galatheae]
MTFNNYVHLVAGFFLATYTLNIHARTELGTDPALYTVEMKGFTDKVLSKELTRVRQGTESIRVKDGQPFTGEVIDEEGRHVVFYIDGHYYGPIHNYSGDRLHRVERGHKDVPNGWGYGHAYGNHGHYFMIDRAKFGRETQFSEANAELPMAGNLRKSWEYHWGERDGFQARCCYTNQTPYVTEHLLVDEYIGIERYSVHEDGTASSNRFRGLNLPKKNAKFDNDLSAVVETFYDNKKLQASIGLKHANPHGETLIANNQGHKLVQVNFVDGARQGVEKRWYGQVAGSDKPQLKTERYFEQGRYHGPERFWNTDGTLLAENHYVNDKLTGISRVWGTGGSLLMVSEYVDGRLHGEERYYIAATPAHPPRQLILTYLNGRLTQARLISESESG